jgi:hypothetical protein
MEHSRERHDVVGAQTILGVANRHRRAPRPPGSGGGRDEHESASRATYTRTGGFAGENITKFETVGAGQYGAPSSMNERIN